MDERDLVIGIDLGTSNSVISHWDHIHNEPEIFQIEFGRTTLPSIVSYDSALNQWLVGGMAKNRLFAYPDESISSIKVHMGTDYRTPQIAGKQWTPVEISSMILKKLLLKAQGPPGGEGPVPQSKPIFVTVCHPYDFDNQAKKDTKEAARLCFSDLAEDRIQLLEEPTAAALAYGLAGALKEGQIILVFDLGGGTFDITIFQALIQDDTLKLEVLALEGDKNLGGNDFDNIISEKFKEYFKENGVDIDTHPQSKKILQYLMNNAEETKIFLSSNDNYSVVLQDPNDPFSVPITKIISRNDFAEWSKSMIKKIEELLESAMSKAKARRGFANLDHVLMVGGSTNIPRVLQLVEEVFGQPPHLAPDRAAIVSSGATLYSAIQGGYITGPLIEGLPYKKIVVENILPHDIGIQAQFRGQDIFYQIFPSGSKYPTGKKACKFVLTGDRNQEDLIIMEAMKKVPGRIPIPDFLKKGGIQIGRHTFENVGGKQREIIITFEVKQDGFLEGTLQDENRAPQRFVIDRYKSSSSKLDL
jgi:molecular chaperone DnaK